jgi:two-component system response regulator
VASDTEIRKINELKLGPRCVLFVEDSEADFELALMRLTRAGLQNKVLRVCTADEMLEYLRSMDAYLDLERFPMPAVIMIDQHLPGSDGIEAQEMLHSTARFRRIPIIAISSPEQVVKLKSAVELGANGSMTKPFDAREFARICRELELQLDFAPTAA